MENNEIFVGLQVGSTVNHASQKNASLIPKLINKLGPTC